MTRSKEFIFWLLCVAPVIVTAGAIATTSSNYAKSEAQSSVIVELAIVCDKEFGDLFQQNRTRILEYWTVFLADLNLRFKSLPSSHISIRVTSVIVISSTEDQPWIESVREQNGTIKLSSVIGEFAKWAYRTRRSLPKFDVIMGVTGAFLEGITVGVAYGKGACLVDHVNNRGKFSSAMMVADKGTWNVGAAAHELGHLLGASHDEDAVGCTHNGYIMSGMTPKRQYFFSPCSDRAISDFLTSRQASCLKRIDHPSRYVLPIPGVRPPSLEVQCQRLLQNMDGFVHQEGSNCQQIQCAQWHKEGHVSIRTHYPVNGSPCNVGKETGKCFRGTCLPLGFLIENFDSGQCLAQKSPFSLNDTPVMAPCTKNVFSQFYLLSSGNVSKKLIATPYSVYTHASMDIESGVKCLHVNDEENDDNPVVNLVQCTENSTSSFLEWDLIDVAPGKVMLSNAPTGQCLGLDIESSQIALYKNCGKNDPRMIWKLHSSADPQNRSAISEKIVDDGSYMKNDLEAQSVKSHTESLWIYFLIACLTVSVVVAMVLIGFLWPCFHISSHDKYSKCNTAAVSYNASGNLRIPSS